MDKPWGVERDNVSKAVDPPTFVSHFQKKNQTNKQTKTQIYPSFKIQLENIFKELKKEKCFSISDSHKSMVEISNF